MQELAPVVRWLKIGMTLFYEAGPTIVTELRSSGFEVFLDLKLHDIPHQVCGAAEKVAALGARLLTVHAAGGEEMVRAAVEGAAAGAAAAGLEPPRVIAVTVLTSTDDAKLRTIGIERDAATQAALLAGVARRAGAAGVVCSPLEAAAMRALLGADAAIVTPGVRPAGAALGDQARVSTPASALKAGASHLVVGRPITEAPDPVAAARRILEEMEEVRR